MYTLAQVIDRNGHTLYSAIIEVLCNDPEDDTLPPTERAPFEDEPCPATQRSVVNVGQCLMAGVTPF